MQKDSVLVPPLAPSASKAAMNESQQASASGVPGNSETALRPRPKAHRKPSMSKVILRAMADKAAHDRISLATLKKAVIATGYDMSRNAWRFKQVLKRLVDKGVLKQVTGKGALGSFRLGKKRASKTNLKAKRQRRRQRQPGQHGSLLGSRQGHKQLFKGVRRGAKSHHS
ncbi:spermatid-specific linker histone H1-like protein [Tupaia chinensis]|uniref:spermatid-specific linker histone H1-like protein n=1 Tax=Tupaia chinensis TaxID=246437 RepID=UPI0003C8CBB6|nr:spermatid-specific linker histone H1-like protein [Tupaia chinensis]